MPAALSLSQHPFETVPSGSLDGLRAALKECRESAVRHAESCMALPNISRRHLGWIAQMVDCREACKACEALLGLEGDIPLQELRDRLNACAEICDTCFRAAREQDFDREGEGSLHHQDCAGQCRYVLDLLPVA